MVRSLVSGFHPRKGWNGSSFQWSCCREGFSSCMRKYQAQWSRTVSYIQPSTSRHIGAFLLFLILQLFAGRNWSIWTENSADELVVCCSWTFYYQLMQSLSCAISSALFTRKFMVFSLPFYFDVFLISFTSLCQLLTMNLLNFFCPS